MDDLTRRNALKAVVAGAAVYAGSTGNMSAEDKKGQAYSFADADAPKSCRLLARTIDGTAAKATVVPGIVNDTYILLVMGKKPYINMTITLSPLTYVRVPEYWEIEVVACLPGIGLPTIGTYFESLPLEGIRGAKGIEVIWNGGETEKIEVPPKR